MSKYQTCRAFWGEGMGAELSLSIWCVCVPAYRRRIIRISPFPITRWGNPAAGPEPAAQTQHRPLRASRCSFMTTVPSVNLRIFPNISPAPYPPSGWNLSPAFLPFGLTGSMIPVPDHSSLRVPLLSPWKTPPFATKDRWAFFSLSSKAPKSSTCWHSGSNSRWTFFFA